MSDTPNAAYIPDFELSHRDAVRESNWSEYEAQGFGVVWEAVDPDDSLGQLAFARDEFGIANVYTGDAFDHEADRPLRHKPGMGIYVSPEGVSYRDAKRARQGPSSDQSSDEPAAS